MPVRLLKSLARKLLGRKEPVAHTVAANPSPAKEPQARHAVPPKPRESPHGHEPRRPQRPERPHPERHEPRRDRAEPSRRESRAPSRAWTLDDFQVPPAEGKTRFHDLHLPVELMRAVADLKFQYCTGIQAAIFPDAMAGRNVAGRAQTGTGKTAAFLLSIMTRFWRNPLSDRRPRRPRSLVIAPTRELVAQIISDAEDLGRYTGFRFAAVYGGIDYDKQRTMLTSGPVDIVAATPGRLLDFKRQDVIDLSAVEIVVIDEADRMLDMGFIPDVKTIMRCLPPRHQRQTMLFSATLSRDVMNLASQWMPDPVVIEIDPDQVAVDTVEQLFYAVPKRDKFKLLYNLLQHKKLSRVLIFGNRRETVQGLADALQQYGISCDLMSGAVPQNKRQRLLEDFRSGKVRVMVATDVAARGLHIDDISHVVNYELPYEPDSFVHRIGRTGRAGASGTAVSFACEDESFIIPDIEAYVGRPIRCQVPEESLLADLPGPTRPPPRREHAAHPAGPRRGSGSRDSHGGRGGPRRPPRRDGPPSRRA